jgi:hypothetical protein
MRIIITLVVVLVLSNTAIAQTAAPDSSATTCWASVNDSTYASWRPVRGKGFNYCMPPSWKAVGKGDKTSDATKWHGSSAEIGWDTGAPQLRPTSDFSPSSLRDQKDFYEQIAGRGMKARLYVFRRWYFTQVTWSQTPIYFQGTAQDSKSANEELKIYRTVRFDEN